MSSTGRQMLSTMNYPPFRHGGELSGPEQSTRSASTNTSFLNITRLAEVPEGCVVLQSVGFVPWDNPDNIISWRTEGIANMIIVLGFLKILYFISAPTNIINMLVFARQGVGDRVNMCLFLQSLADFIYMTVNFLIYVDRSFTDVANDIGKRPIYRFVLKNYLAGFHGFHRVSFFMTMIIACDRCFCVLSPLRAQRILKAKSTLIIIAVGSVFLLVPYFLNGSKWNLACAFDPITKSTSPVEYPSQFYLRHKALIDMLDGFLYGTVLGPLLTVVVAVCTGITVFKLKKMTSWREQTSSVNTSIRDVSLTRMLIGVSVLFIVCHTPTILLRLLIISIPEFRLNSRYHNVFKLTIKVCELLTFFNSSFNFFIYFTLGTKYKETLLSMCARKKMSK